MADEKLEAYMLGAIETFTLAKAEIKSAMKLIRKGAGRHKHAQALQLLALRRYIRVRDKRVHAQWAWTPEQARELIKSAQAQALLAETAKVQQAFAKQHPGYELLVSPLRSLERQVSLWGGNRTVAQASEKLWKQTIALLGDEISWPNTPTGKAIVNFRTFLHDVAVTPEPSSAAPGLSDHGRMHAVDLVVAQDGDLVAGTDTKEIASKWQRDGWGQKLIEATAGTRLVGPLKHPFEPWHWVLK